ncbi:MAG: DUF1015 domain-containing protein [Candidatus Competibacteraceae bacterium]|nr:DUF1015 domain-containing protein [Candidatus Competibacteraceae bacterium]
MATVIPFRGWMPRSKYAHSIASRPFESYTKGEIDNILQQVPESFLHVIMPQISHESSTLTYEEKLHAGKNQFDTFCQKQIFEQDENPCYYIYRQTRDNFTYTGIVAAIAVDDYLNGIIKPHEHTIEHKENKLKHYLEILQINAEPVIITYTPHLTLQRFLNERMLEPAFLHFQYEDFGLHEVWKISTQNEIDFVKSCFSETKNLFIADGHHRTGSSALLAQEKRKENPNYTGNEPYNYFMGILLPSEHIQLHEFNRMIFDVNGIEIEKLIEQLSNTFYIEHHTSYPGLSTHPACFAMYIESGWYSLQLRPEIYQQISEDSVLPTSILSDYLLSPVFNIHDLRKDKRIGFKGGKTEPILFENMVKQGNVKAVFIVNKISISELERFASKGWFMPPKTTYFEPKLLNGLFIYSLT